MKKYVVLAIFPLLAACAHCGKDCRNKTQEPAPMPVVYEIPYEEVSSCACAQEPLPCVEIQRPRIVEEVPVEMPKRPCDNYQMLNGGCGAAHYQIFDPRQELEFYELPKPRVLTYIPAQPESYRLAANRAFNRFIKDTYGIYSQDPNVKIFVEKPVAKNSDLPGGIEKGVEAFKTQVNNSHTFVVTEEPNETDYTLQTTAEWFDTPSKNVPAIKYVTKLIDKDGKEIGVWSQIVKRADNKSWL